MNDKELRSFSIKTIQENMITKETFKELKRVLKKIRLFLKLGVKRFFSRLFFFILFS